MSKAPPKDGLVVEYYGNGQKEQEGNWTNGERYGLETRWYVNGKKKSETHHKDGHLDGLWTRWYENGQKSGEGHYKNGKEDGIHTRWYENGQKLSEDHYKDGELERRNTWWHDSGKKLSEIYYKNGKLYGLWTYSENGKKHTEKYYKYLVNGELIARPFLWRKGLSGWPLAILGAVTFFGMFGVIPETVVDAFYANGQGNLFSFLLALGVYFGSALVACGEIYERATCSGYYRSTGEPTLAWLRQWEWFTLMEVCLSLLFFIPFFIGGQSFTFSVGISFLFSWVVCVSLLPAWIAMKKRHPQLLPLFIVNFFTGLTVIGWAACLAWAYWKFDKPDSD